MGVLGLMRLDEIFVFLQMPYELVDHFRQVLMLLTENSVILTLKKWEFFTDNVYYFRQNICHLRLNSPLER